MDEIKIKPIGVARNTVKESRFGEFDDEITEIEVEEEYKDGLNCIDDYSHLIIVFWMDKVRSCNIIHRPQGNPDVPEVGIFSCRCPPRPNHIAMTTVRLVGHEGNRIKVKGLDIIDGTPIIDIKPFWPQYDNVEEWIIPDWVNKLKL
jgi:tRNA-Thr(GGU) m(6)t(6)A37 methyltransferase TsaA